MKPNRTQILIVEDDATQNKALSEAFSRAGFQVTSHLASVKALANAQHQEFHFLIVDCMLPKMNGVDLVEEILSITPNKPKVILFSGIFKDRQFIKEAMEKTGALAFLTKPLNLPELVKQVSASCSEATEPSTSITSLYSAETLTDERILRLIKVDSVMHSGHLPMLLKRLRETKLTGEIYLTSDVGDICTVDLYRGQIFNVKTPDRETPFGGIAVGLGFVSPDEVLMAMSQDLKGPIGQRLIQSLSLSPHAVQVVLEEQLALRLSQTLHGGATTVEFKEQAFTPPEYVLKEERFHILLNDWSRSKIEVAWIKSLCLTWGSNQIHGHYHNQIENCKTINDLIGHPDFVENEDFTYFYKQLLLGNCQIGPLVEGSLNFEFLEKRLTQMLEEHKTQNLFQILGLGETARALEINKAFFDLREHFDPKKLPADVPSSVAVKCINVFENIDRAHKTLCDDVARNRYVQELQKQRSKSMMENEPIFRAAILEISNGQYAQAEQRLKELLAQKIEFKDLRAYRIWAGVKVNKSFEELTLDQIPPEERHSAAFFMAKGVYLRARGQLSMALESFQAAHAMDTRLNIARSEAESLREEMGLNRGLLKDVSSALDSLLGGNPRRKGA